jgi:hypothetical protein
MVMLLDPQRKQLYYAIYSYAYADVLFGYTCLQIFTQSKYFVIVGLKTIFPTQFVGVSIIYIPTKFHIPRPNK